MKRDIGGIIESSQQFYRHFNLEYGNVDIPIRCAYVGVFEEKKLSINCLEYKEIESTRILSNGEIEKVRIEDPNYKPLKIAIIDVKDYVQTLHMVIT